MSWRRQTGAGLAVLLLLAVAVFGIRLVPGVIWRGTAVWEPCEAKVRDLYGDDVTVLRDEAHIRWAPPGWVCPLSNGDELTP